MKRVVVTVSASSQQPPTHGEGAPRRPRVGDRLEGSGSWVQVYARATLPTRYGTFDLLVFRCSDNDEEHLALVRGDVCAGTVSVRLHSECLTGDVLGSLRCDCRDQLEMSLSALGSMDAGVLLYLRQEGRGIGLGNKVRAYALQEQGFDTYEANHHLGFDDDLRDYRVAALMLRLLGITEIELATNNPRKILGLRSHGIQVGRRLPLVAARNPHNSRYLDAKAKKSGHILPSS